MEKSMDTDSVDSEKLLSEDEESANNQAFLKATSFTAVECKTPTPESTTMKTSKDNSFSSDAVGNGDVAEVMGKTLDMVAGVISEILSESDHLKPLSRVEDSKGMTNKSEREDLEPLTVDGNKKETTNENRIGELVLNSHDESTTKSSFQEDDDSEWSVVKSVRSGGTSESEQIAKAAEV